MGLHDDVVEASLDYYHDLAPRNRYVPKPFPDDTLPDRLASSARAAVASPTDTASRLVGTGVRTLHDVSRNTLIENVRREKGKWARVPAEDACGFCRILGTRGPVYRSKHAALASHDGCGCEARIQRPGTTLELPKYMAGWNDDYRRHVGAAKGKSGRDQINAIANSWNRELFATGVRDRSKKGHDHEEVLRDAA